MKTLKVGGKTVDAYVVETFVASEASRLEPGIKVAAAPERYAFYKDAFSQGAEGRLFAARHGVTQKPYCIKEIRLRAPKSNTKKGASIVDWRTAAQRAMDEIDHAQQASRAFGPVHVFANAKGSKLYVVQNVLSGRVMDAIKAMSQNASRADVVSVLALMAARDLQAIHDAGVLHLDVKPDNMCYNAKTRAVEIIDFGISLKGDWGTASGASLQYSCAEQAEGRPVGRPADVFSLGATFGRFALGRPVLGKSKTDHGQKLVFTAQHWAQMAQGTLRTPAFVQHHARYTQQLFDFDPKLAVLTAEMMDPNAQARPPLHAVIGRLEAMQPSEPARRAIDGLWDTLPAYDPIFEACLQDLDEGLLSLGIQAL